MSISLSSAIHAPRGYATGDHARSSTNGETTAADESSGKNDRASASSTDSARLNGQMVELTEAQMREVERLQERDREVRAHERAHMTAGGSYVRGGATFEYQRGPDGRRYAVGGEVNIDISEVPGDPEATARKMRAVKRAALSPAEPSSQDRMVAARASRIENEMNLELMQLKMAQADAEYRKSSELLPGDESGSGQSSDGAPEGRPMVHVIG